MVRPGNAGKVWLQRHDIRRHSCVHSCRMRRWSKRAVARRWSLLPVEPIRHPIEPLEHLGEPVEQLALLSATIASASIGGRAGVTGRAGRRRKPLGGHRPSLRSPEHERTQHSGRPSGLNPSHGNKPPNAS